MATTGSTETGKGARVWVLAGSLLLGAVGLYWIGDAFVVDGELQFGNPVAAAPAALPRSQPVQVRAEVVRVTGNLEVEAGDECLFLVERHDLPQGGFECRAQISCGGVLLYGGPKQGYFPCALSGPGGREVVGTDPLPSYKDHDAAMHLDTARGILRIRDDGFGTHGELSVDAEVLDVR